MEVSVEANRCVDECEAAVATLELAAAATASAEAAAIEAASGVSKRHVRWRLMRQWRWWHAAASARPMDAPTLHTSNSSRAKIGVPWRR